MKFILAVSVWLICISAGFKQWLKIKQRSLLLEQTALVLDCFRNEIEYNSLSLLLLIEKYSSPNYVKPDFIIRCNEKLASGFDFPSAWRMSVEESDALFSNEEKSRLLILGDLLGTSDSRSQCEFLETQQKYFTERTRQAKAKTDKYAGSFLCSGIFIGFAFFIFIV